MNPNADLTLRRPYALVLTLVANGTSVLLGRSRVLNLASSQLARHRGGLVLVRVRVRVRSRGIFSQGLGRAGNDFHHGGEKQGQCDVK